MRQRIITGVVTLVLLYSTTLSLAEPGQQIATQHSHQERGAAATIVTGFVKVLAYIHEYVSPRIPSGYAGALVGWVDSDQASLQVFIDPRCPGPNCPEEEGGLDESLLGG